MKTTQQIFDEAKILVKANAADVGLPISELFILAVTELSKERDLEHQLELQRLYYTGAMTTMGVQTQQQASGASE